MVATELSTIEKLRAHWWTRQGFNGSLDGSTPSHALERIGWARSVGGASPYLALFSRCGTRRAEVDAALLEMRIAELPSARGCTYVLPSEEFRLGLTASSLVSSGDASLLKKLEVSEEELDALSKATLAALQEGPLEPEGIKAKVGAYARSLGDAGKRAGTSNTLPLVLSRLQASGQIVRQPVEARLDRQRYAYKLWMSSPLVPSKEEEAAAATQLAYHFFGWAGPASMEEFQNFSGFSRRAARKAVASLFLVPIEGDDKRLMLPNEASDFVHQTALTQPDYRLLGNLDSYLVNRAHYSDLIDEIDQPKLAQFRASFGEVPTRQGISSNPIFDRGRLIGVWECDLEMGELVWLTFSPVEDLERLKKKVKEARNFIEHDLGDFRSFSLDSPKSRQPRIEAIREWPRH